MNLDGDSNICEGRSARAGGAERKKERKHLIIGRFAVVRLPQVVRGAEDLARPLDGIFHLACHEQRCQSHILVIIFRAGNPEAEPVVIYRSCVECFYRPARDKMSTVLPLAKEGRRDEMDTYSCKPRRTVSINCTPLSR